MNTPILWNIFNTSTGVNLGDYPGEGPDAALDAMARDAGYKSYRDLNEQNPNGDVLRVAAVALVAPDPAIHFPRWDEATTFPDLLNPRNA